MLLSLRIHRNRRRHGLHGRKFTARLREVRHRPQSSRDYDDLDGDRASGGGSCPAWYRSGYLRDEVATESLVRRRRDELNARWQKVFNPTCWGKALLVNTTVKVSGRPTIVGSGVAVWLMPMPPTVCARALATPL